MLISGGGGTAPGVVYYWQPGNSAWEDKTGDLSNYGVTVGYDIDRDSDGAA